MGMQLDDEFDDERKILFTCNQQACEFFDGTLADTTISLSENKYDNLILAQDGSEVVLSWDELQELVEFYHESMEELEKKYA